MKLYKYFLIALAVIAIDQTSKLLVHHYMFVHQEINVLGDWFRLHYLLNPGMAFGIRWDNEFGKLALTFFRIGAMVGIAYYLVRAAKRNAPVGFLVCIALILGGAIGNVIDSTFYGVIFDNALPDSPTSWFHGQVIDMLYFPLFGFQLPDWVPLRGGAYFSFFDPVFNVADSCIFIGVASILIFQRSFFPRQEEEEQQSHENELQVNPIDSENTSPIVGAESHEVKPEAENNS